MVPNGLRVWFVVHAVVDVVFALPLLIAPEAVLGLVGWTTVDPYTTRMVAAALLGIGIQSYIGRNEERSAFRGMLNLKIIWSLGCIVGIGASIITANGPAPLFAWVVLLIFVIFFMVWTTYHRRLG
jgi:hypothetical protein